MFQSTTERVNSLTIDDVAGQAVPESVAATTFHTSPGKGRQKIYEDWQNIFLENSNKNLVCIARDNTKSL